MTSPAPPFDPGNPFTPGSPSDMVTAILPGPGGRDWQMIVTIRIPGNTLTVHLDKHTGEQWAANIAEAASLLAEPPRLPGSPDGRWHAHG